MERCIRMAGGFRGLSVRVRIGRTRRGLTSPGCWFVQQSTPVLLSVTARRRNVGQLSFWPRCLGQAIQNINVLLGLSETTGLEHRGLFPDMRALPISPPAPPPGLRGSARGFWQHQKHHHHDAGGESAEEGDRGAKRQGLADKPDQGWEKTRRSPGRHRNRSLAPSRAPRSGRVPS
jgi:hypothetical protein